MHFYTAYIGRHFASPIKQGERADRATRRSMDKFVREHSSTPVPCSSRSLTPVLSSEKQGPSTSAEVAPQDPSSSAKDPPRVETCIPLVARIELLENEIKKLRETPKEKSHFRIEDIQHDDKMVLFYTGFVSYNIFSAFF